MDKRYEKVIVCRQGPAYTAEHQGAELYKIDKTSLWNVKLLINIICPSLWPDLASLRFFHFDLLST